MKMKFPNGVLLYIDAYGQQHRPDEKGELSVNPDQLDLISSMRTAGFVDVLQDAEAAVEEAQEPSDSTSVSEEDKPTRVPAE